MAGSTKRNLHHLTRHYPDGDDKKDEFSTKEKYSINESLLQSYRQIFISAQSFLIGVAVFALDKSGFVFVLISAAGIGIIFLGWADFLGLLSGTKIKPGVIIARARIVDYYKYDIEKYKFEKEDVRLKDYILNQKIRDDINGQIKEMGKAGNWRETRIKVDRYIPLIFILVWILLLLNYIILY